MLSQPLSNLVACLLGAIALSLAFAVSADAWPGNETDLCAKVGSSSEVTTTDPKSGPNARGEQGVWTIRACSPNLRLTRLGVASPTEMFRHVEPRRVMEGGATAPAISQGRLRLFPYMMGPEGTAVRYEAVLGSDIVRDAIIGAVGGFTSTIAIGVASCVLGLVATAGIACAASMGMLEESANGLTSSGSARAVSTIFPG